MSGITSLHSRFLGKRLGKFFAIRNGHRIYNILTMAIQNLRRKHPVVGKSRPVAQFVRRNYYITKKNSLIAFNIHIRQTLKMCSKFFCDSPIKS